MVLITFTWRYGGSQVYLYGSFNGWSDQLLMNLVEGSATVFQRIIDLPPGYHQYKFLIDGTWQVDQDQFCVQDEYGVINNLIFVEESDSTASALLREDNQSKLVSGFARSMHLEASSSHGLQLEPVMQLSANEIDVSRSRLFMLLSSSRADELIPNSGKVFALDSEVAVKQAFHIMYEQVRFSMHTIDRVLGSSWVRDTFVLKLKVVANKYLLKQILEVVICLGDLHMS